MMTVAEARRECGREVKFDLRPKERFILIGIDLYKNTNPFCKCEWLATLMAVGTNRAVTEVHLGNLTAFPKDLFKRKFGPGVKTLESQGEQIDLGVSPPSMSRK